MTTEDFRLEDWYTATQAAERLSLNSGRPIDKSYPRTLAGYKKIRSYEISESTKLYFRADVDNYVVEARGVKSARAQRVKKAERKPKKGKTS